MPFHDNNGKSAMAAVFFAMQGNRPKEAQFFAKMAIAGYKNRECGHTGQGFSYLWGALGRQCRRTRRGGGVLQGGVQPPRPGAALRRLVHL